MLYGCSLFGKGRLLCFDGEFIILVWGNYYYVIVDDQSYVFICLILEKIEKGKKKIL